MRCWASAPRQVSRLRLVPIWPWDSRLLCTVEAHQLHWRLRLVSRPRLRMLLTWPLHALLQHPLLPDRHCRFWEVQFLGRLLGGAVIGPVVLIAQDLLSSSRL